MNCIVKNQVMSSTFGQDSTQRIQMNLEQFESLQKKQEQSGLAEKPFCKANDVCLAAFRYWKKKWASSSKHRVNFVEINAPDAEASISPDVPFECQLANGRVLRIPQKFDMSSLKLILSIVDP